MSKIAIIGLGYVGLPLAFAHFQSGIEVIGFDTDPNKLDLTALMNSGSDELTREEFQKLIKSNFRVTDDFKRIAECEYIIITVPTPLSLKGLPDLTYIETVLTSIQDHLVEGQTLILESTTYPGTTREIIWPIVEKYRKNSVNIFLGYSPERLDPGNTKYQYRDIPKVIAGIDSESEKKVFSHYSKIFKNIVVAKGLEEAELSKILENTYRHVNIALVNELAKYCHELNIDIWDVIDLAKTKPYGFQAFYPGPGVGGHCIPVDPSYLTYEIKRKLGKAFDLIETSKIINNSMPKYISERISEELRQIVLKKSEPSILILGVTYKENIADTRETPIKFLIEELAKKQMNVKICDPLVVDRDLDFSNYEKIGIKEITFNEFDLIVIGRLHDEFKFINFNEIPTKVFNLGRKIPGPNIINL